MSEKFVFQGNTTYINKPRDTVIQGFQNTYVSGDSSDLDKANIELKKLVELIIDSRDLGDSEKEDSIEAIHDLASDIKDKKGNKLSLKGTLNAIKDITANTADIASPATAIISTVLKLLGLS